MMKRSEGTEYDDDDSQDDDPTEYKPSRRTYSEELEDEE